MFSGRKPVSFIIDKQHRWSKWAAHGNFDHDKALTGHQSRTLRVGDRVCWQNNRADQGTITEKNWAGVTIKWDNRSKQAIHHNDMAQVEQVPNKMV
jgi:hypothetical protein